MQSFKNLSMWKKEFLYYADIEDGNNFPFVILANKIDMDNRCIPEREGIIINKSLNYSVINYSILTVEL
jgi:hypothetical protein